MSERGQVFTQDSAYREDLRRPFPPEQIGHLPPRGGKVLDYIGHAAVTDRLNDAAPDWTWEPVEWLRSPEGALTGLLGRITIGGKTLYEAGSVERAMADGEAMKQLISDFIRRGAMRFGVGLDLWSKEELPGGEPGDASGTGARSSRSRQGKARGAAASSVPDDNVADPELQRGRTGIAASSEPADVEPAGAQSATTTSGASTPLDATPDRDGDGTAPRPQEPPSADDEPEQGGAVSSRHVHEWVDAPTKGFVLCSVCRIGRPRADVEVGA